MKYEYKIFKGDGPHGGAFTQTGLNDIGKDGWQLVEVTSWGQWIFMREIEEVQAKIYKNPAYGSYGKLADSVARTVEVPVRKSQYPEDLTDPFHDEGNATNHRISQCGPRCKTIRCHDDRIEGIGSL